MVARFVRDEEAVGSNPATPTMRAGSFGAGSLLWGLDFCCCHRLTLILAICPGYSGQRLTAAGPLAAEGAV